MQVMCNISSAYHVQLVLCTTWSEGTAQLLRGDVAVATKATLTVVRARVKCVLIYCNNIDSGQSKSTVCSYIL